MNTIITGASRGIGKAIAERFAEAGHVLLLNSRNDKALYDAVADLQTRFPHITIKAKPADLSNKEEAKQFGEWCLEAGTPGILVNNAGLFWPGNVHDEAEDQMEKMMAVNLYSAYHLTRTILPAMITAKTGHVFNMCSIASLQAYKHGGSYSISKFALLGFSKNLRDEMKPHGIKVTAVCPGGVMTDSWAGSNVDPKRIMEAADIAKMVYAASQLSPMAVVEDIILRPQLGDL
jgi:short-subunit dehydrogenase